MVNHSYLMQPITIRLTLQQTDSGCPTHANVACPFYLATEMSQYQVTNANMRRRFTIQNLQVKACFNSLWKWPFSTCPKDSWPCKGSRIPRKPARCTSWENHCTPLQPAQNNKRRSATRRPKQQAERIHLVIFQPCEQLRSQGVEWHKPAGLISFCWWPWLFPRA